MAQRDVGCEGCGAVLPMEISSYSVDKPKVWHPGKKCPICGSEKFYPVIPITDTDRAQEEPTSVKRRLLLNPWTGIAAVVVTVGVVLAIVLWPSRGLEDAQVLFYCEHCNKVFLGSKNAAQPVKCPECGERAGYRAAACTVCSRVYSFHEKECPHCKKAVDRRMLTSMKEVEEARRKHQEYLRSEEETEEYEDEN